MSDPFRPELVIFDCDGVLVDSEAVANRVWVALLAEHGLRFAPRDFLRRAVGSTLTALYEGLREDHGWERPERFDSELDERLAAAFRDVTAIDGVTDVLDLLDERGVPFAVASNAREDRLRLKLGAAGLLPRFEGRVFHPGLVTRGKPEPDLYLHAARTLGREPEACLVVEDSVLGAMAGVRAAMTVWGFTGGAHALEGLADDLRSVGAARVLDSMTAVRSGLTELFGPAS